MVRPTNIVSGDTYTWDVSNGDYLASAGWTLKVTINSATHRLQVTAATDTDGDSFDVTLSAANTLALATPGAYTLVEAVEKGSGATIERHTLFQGTVNVTASVAGVITPIDSRSMARKMLDAVEATILGNLGKGHESMSIAARAIGYRSWDEMLKARGRLKLEVANEEAAERISQGLDGGNRIVTRMGYGTWR